MQIILVISIQILFQQEALSWDGINSLFSVLETPKLNQPLREITVLSLAQIFHHKAYSIPNPPFHVYDALTVNLLDRTFVNWSPEMMTATRLIADGTLPYRMQLHTESIIGFALNKNTQIQTKTELTTRSPKLTDQQSNFIITQIAAAKKVSPWDFDFAMTATKITEIPQTPASDQLGGVDMDPAKAQIRTVGDPVYMEAVIDFASFQRRFEAEGLRLNYSPLVPIDNPATLLSMK